MSLELMSVSSLCDMIVTRTKSDQAPIIIVLDFRIKEAVRLAVYIREQVFG